MTPQAFLRHYEERLSTRNFHAVAPLISEDAVFWFTDGTHQGLKAIEAAFQETWHNIEEERYWLEDVVWLTTDDKSASCIYSFHWQGLWRGEPASGSGRGTTVSRKSGSDWKIVHEHLSRFPAC